MAKLFDNKIFKRGKHLQMLKGFIIVLILFIFSLSMISAQEMENYKGDLTYYDFIDERGIDWEVKFEPQNNIDKMISSVIYIDLVSVPTINEDILMKLIVNGELHCSPEIFKISKNSDGTADTTKKIKFDCFNIINKVGIYNLHLSSTQIIKGITGSYEIIYYVTPSWQKAIENIENKINETSWQESIENIEKRLEKKITMGTGGTEYLPNDPARIFARLLDGNSRPINIASCNATIYFPNNTKFLNNVALTLLEKGIYYYDFITPNITGNYITVFDCIEPSIPFTQNRTIGVDIGAGSPTFSDNFPFDNSNNITINNAWIYYSVTGGGGGANNNYYFNGELIATASGITQNVNVSLHQENFTYSETQQFAIQRTSLSSTINWVRLIVNYTWNDPQQLIRGQDEVHVTDIIGKVWNYTEKNITNVNYTYFNNQFNQTWLNQQTIYNFIQSMNTTIVNNQVYLKGKIDDIWDYVQEMINKIYGMVIS